MEDILFLCTRPMPHLFGFSLWLIGMWVSYYHQGKHLWWWQLMNWGSIGFGVFLFVGLIAAIFYVPKSLEAVPYLTFIIDHAFYWAWGGLLLIGGVNCWLTVVGRKK